MIAIKRHRNALLAIAGSLVMWAFLFPRMATSSGIGDQGTFLSVAIRMLSGDRLYVDVWDNKDPLFFYILAIAHSISPTATSFLDVIWIALSIAAVFMICRTLGSGWARSLTLAHISMIIFLGSVYYPGMTELPGNAIALLAIALALRDRWFFAGTLAGIAPFIKITTAPLVLFVGVALLVSKHSLRGLSMSAAGATSSAAIMALLLIWRGELLGYIEMIRRNFAYAKSWTGEDARIIQDAWTHLFGSAFPSNGNNAMLPAVACVALVLIACASSSTFKTPMLRHLWLATLIASLSGLTTLSLFGMAPFHTQILYISSSLALTLACAGIFPKSFRNPRVLIGTILLAYILGGGIHPQNLLHSRRSLGDSLTWSSGTSPEATELLRLGETGSYQRIGNVDWDAHARGLDAWTLTCPKFHLYLTDPEESFDETIDCLAESDAVLVDESFFMEVLNEKWNHFQQGVRGVLAAEYTCRDSSFGQVCIRQEP